MPDLPVQLALGTVQFGVAYGIAGRGEMVPEAEARAIFERAACHGIRRLDTAAAYGDIEQRLGRLVGDLPFEVVSKVPAIPSGLAERAAREFVATSIERSRERLGERLCGILFHGAGDLTGPNGPAIWEVGAATASGLGIRIGISAYDPASVDTLRSNFALEMAQVPGNALDQRLVQSALAHGDVEITMRSLFLQGLLLLPLEAAQRKLPAAGQALARWDAWHRANAVAPLVAALGAAKKLPGVKYCVVGVDSVHQLDEIATAWAEARPMDASELATSDPQVIDPRCWGRTA